MKKIHYLLLFTIILTVSVYGQERSLTWFNPAEARFDVVQSRGWQKDLSAFYDRLPARAENTVRPIVWSLSKNSSGLFISFKTNANSVSIRYTVSMRRDMFHMPATGVSGVDLYAKLDDDSWVWTKGSYTFKDTIVFAFNNMKFAEKAKEFRLYLPLYNNVNWLQVGIPDGNQFEFLPAASGKPIVAYGTSIMHGACASRPGLSWTNILSRKLNKTIINLGFSGNGQLEKGLIDLINELDASLYILDCIPNLVDRKQFPPEEVEKRIRHAVISIQQSHPGIPIILAEHCSGKSNVNMDAAMTERYSLASILAADIYKKMRSEGYKNIYHLSADDIGLDFESTVDGTHPNDIGMMQYANAYEKIIRKNRLMGK